MKNNIKAVQLGAPAWVRLVETIGLAMLLVGVLGVSAARATIIFADNFESRTPGISINGQLPNAWTVSQNDALVVNDAATARSGNQYLALENTVGSPSTTTASVALSSPLIDGRSMFSFAFRFDAANAGNELHMDLYGASSSGYITRLLMSVGSLNYYDENNVNQYLGELTPNVWYDVTEVMFPSTKNYQFTLNKFGFGIVFNEILPMDSSYVPTTMTAVNFGGRLYGTPPTATTWLLDNVDVEQIPEPSILLLLGVGGGLLAWRRRRS